MRRLICLCLMLLGMTTAVMAGKPAEFEIGKTRVCVEFYTPSIVRVVKSPVGHAYEKQSLVVIS